MIQGRMAYKFTNQCVWWAGLLVFWRCNILLVCVLEASACTCSRIQTMRLGWPAVALLVCLLLLHALSLISSARLELSSAQSSSTPVRS